MRTLRIDSYVINTPLIEIIEHLRLCLTNGKLKEIKAWHEGEDNIVVSCPHHKDGLEAHAACNIFVGNNTKIEYGYFKCWVCDEQGSFVKFVAECFDSTEAYAKDWLIKNYGVYSSVGVSLGADISLVRKSKSQNPYKKIDPTILDQFQSWHPYLAQRKLSRDVCNLFNVKYDQNLRQIVFPCYDNKDNLIMMPRRSIDYKTFYLDKDVEKPVYCLNYVNKRKFTKAIITEGPFDCLTGWTYGYPTIATFGNPSDYQIAQINKSCIQVLYTMFDNDEAGAKFTRAVKAKLDKRIIVVEVKIPDGKKDINDLTQEEFESIMMKYKKSSR